MSKKGDKRIERKEKKRAIQAGRPLPGGPIVGEVTEEPEPLVTVSFRYVKAGKEMCLSLCEAEDVCQAVDCLRQACSLTWQGLVTHNGLRYKPIPDHSLTWPRPQEIDAAIPIHEIRFTKRGRVFGIKSDGAFHILRFDPLHDGTGR